MSAFKLLTAYPLALALTIIRAITMIATPGFLIPWTISDYSSIWFKWALVSGGIHVLSTWIMWKITYGKTRS